MDRIKKIVHKWVWVLLVFYCFIGLIYPYIGIAALVCMLVPSAVALIRGRMWCGNFCPRGSFNDIILSKISRNKKIPPIMKSMWFKTLFLILLMGAFAVQLFFAWGNLFELGKVFIRMILITSGITVILGISFSHRTWCVICPMGTMAHFVTKITPFSWRIRNVNFKKDACVNCKLCSKSCPVGIDVLCNKNEGKVTNADCLKCNVCVDKCPKKSLYMA